MYSYIQFCQKNLSKPATTVNYRRNFLIKFGLETARPQCVALKFWSEIGWPVPARKHQNGVTFSRFSSFWIAFKESMLVGANV